MVRDSEALAILSPGSITDDSNRLEAGDLAAARLLKEADSSGRDRGETQAGGKDGRADVPADPTRSEAGGGAMNDGPGAERAAGVDPGRHIDRLCDRFEAAWRAGDPGSKITWPRCPRRSAAPC
jgi:hypothetical protein